MPPVRSGRVTDPAPDESGEAVRLRRFAVVRPPPMPFRSRRRAPAGEAPVARLPEALRPRHVPALERLGRAHDGGYLVDVRSVDASDVLVGLGLNDDWSFERDFARRRPVPVVGVDASLGWGMLLTNLAAAATRPDIPGLFLERLRASADYPRFFRGDRLHVRRFAGPSDGAEFVSLDELLGRHVPRPEHRPFLKVDVEGWEYRMIDELIEASGRSTGAVIEFHDVDLHLERIVDFVRRCPLALCHVHCNNHAPRDLAGVPLVIEATFTAFDASEAPTVAQPHPLDMPNHRDRADYRIEYA